MSIINANRFINKVAVVTSSTKGIGLATVKRLAREGAKVMMSSRKEANVNKAVSELRDEGLEHVHGMPCHVGEPEQLRRLFQETKERFGGIDILLPFTGVNMIYGPILDATDSQFDKILDINVKAPFKMVQAAFPFMKDRPNSSIVFMGTYASLNPQLVQLGGSGIDLYSISKGALLVMTKSMAAPLAMSGIRVNTVLPGPIDTDFFSGQFSIDKLIIGNVLHDISNKVKGTPEEVASMIAYLASNEASFITGENFVVAGGLPSRY
ncbi:hypothetical protein CAPTEDRAFT_144205 [Capitella teleta]|uniref:Dehydrogenase/reductase SDR family member 4 n=1 Tax=Capitella teleta TaxID=283909 RepID=R7V869_CAPTE|nr:hypothetical protein CAPTEDRAFT_144205 [Capitella teleta]|eukprot:ELU11965.1 hypothetical protein CAPTEDRAFT_144205 [Capitella teleta]